MKSSLLTKDHKKASSQIVLSQEIQNLNSILPETLREDESSMGKGIVLEAQRVVDETVLDTPQIVRLSNPLKIALLSWESLHSITVGGVAAHVSELGAALNREGHEVHVFTRMGRADHAQYELIDGVHYHRAPFSTHPDFIEETNNMCRSFVSSVFYAEDRMSRAFDVVHAHDWMSSNAMVWIKEGRKRKSVLTIHSTEYGRCGNNFYDGSCKRIRDHERHGTFCADRVISVSNTLKGEIMWMYNVPDWKVNFIYNGVNARFFDGDLDAGEIKKKLGIGPLDPMVLFAGRMTHQKGPDILIEAVPYILRYYPNAKFVFAGDGHLKGPVELRARQLGVAHAARFVGFQNPSALRELYKACECVCVPSRNEPFGIVILEAWSAGKPVIASEVGGPSEIIWHDVTGFKIYPNPNSVPWGIGTLFSNFDHARWMGQNGRRTALKDFSWDHIARQTLKVYQS